MIATCIPDVKIVYTCMMEIQPYIYFHHTRICFTTLNNTTVASTTVTFSFLLQKSHGIPLGGSYECSLNGQSITLSVFWRNLRVHSVVFGSAVEVWRNVLEIWRFVSWCR